MTEQRQKRKGKMTHFMANGEVRNSVRGYVTREDQLPETARRLLCNMFQENTTNIDKWV
ncbi:hypothetical protein [Anaerotignum sp.]|uniref:hypothetical protein n=1 Tax=Anaerotignum sp. TaxID=2039241 RepID=UPI00332EB182